jgi:hypothetical protein
LPLPTPLRWALEEDPQPLALSTRSAWPEWAAAHGYSAEQTKILEACVGKLVRSIAYLQALVSDISGRYDADGGFVEPVSVWDRHSGALALHARTLMKTGAPSSERRSAPKSQPDARPLVTPPTPPTPASLRTPPAQSASSAKRAALHLGEALSASEIARRKAALAGAGE